MDFTIHIHTLLCWLIQYCCDAHDNGHVVSLVDRCERVTSMTLLLDNMLPDVMLRIAHESINSA